MSRNTALLETAPSSEVGQQLFQMTMGGLVTQLLHVAAALNLADELADGAKPVEALARATGVDAAALHRVLRALASLGVFTEVEYGWFGLTPLADRLRSDVPGSFRIMPIYLGEELYRAFGNLLDVVRTGEPVFANLYGMDYFAYLGQNAAAGQTFNAAMTALGAVAETGAVVAAYDFTWARTVIDVGGGHGDLLAAILEANPGLRGVLFDLPAVIDAEQSAAMLSPLADRAESKAGDFFSAVPSGGDVYVLKRIIHDWDDERCITLLRNCRQAMAPDSRLLIVEDALPDGDAPSPGKLVDVVLMCILPGRERTTDEYRTLLDAAGFTLARVIPTASPMAILEALPA